MRGAVPVWALAFLGLLTAASCALHAQQPNNAGTPGQLQVDGGPFAEETRQLAAATDKAARRDAFAAILKKAKDIKRDPEPLLTILRNKKPEETFRDLLGWVKETESARLECLLPVLVTTAAEAGEAAKPALLAVKAYDSVAVDKLYKMLTGDNDSERMAAIVVSAERVGDLGGGAKLVSRLVKIALEGAPAEQGAAMASLKSLTLLTFEKPAEWKNWLGRKTETDLVLEIGNRESERADRLQEQLRKAEEELQAVEIDRMKRELAQNPVALIERLVNGPYVGVKCEAARLLGTILPTLDDKAATAPIDALGAALNDGTAPEALRKACAMALAELRSGSNGQSAKASQAFVHIDKALETNGISPELKLELVKSLNTPQAAPRLAHVLKVEVDVVETRSGELLKTAINQVRNVLDPGDAGPNRDLLLGQLSRLLAAVSRQLANNKLPSPARERFVDLALKTNDLLQHLARLRGVDVGSCVDALLQLARTDSSAAGSALTALSEAAGVPATREALHKKLTSPPESQALATLYLRLLAAKNEPTLVSLLGLCEALAISPEPADALKTRLMELVATGAATLPAIATHRANMRDALRGLLARLNSVKDAQAAEKLHGALIAELLANENGDKDAIGYILNVPQSRMSVIQAAVTDFARKTPLRAGVLMNDLSPRLTAPERDGAGFKALRDEVRKAVRTAIGEQVEPAIANGLNDETKASLGLIGNGVLRKQFVIVCVEKLHDKSAPGEGRDAVAELLVSVLKQAHPEKYDAVALKGLDAKAFEAAIDELKKQLKTDGYEV